MLELACSRSGENPRPEDVKINSLSKYTAALGGFQMLKGTSYLMAPVTNIGSHSDRISSYESYNSGVQNHNLVLLDTNSLA